MFLDVGVVSELTLRPVENTLRVPAKISVSLRTRAKSATDADVLTFIQKRSLFVFTLAIDCL